MTLKTIDLFSQIIAALIFCIFNWSNVPEIIPAAALIALVIIQVVSLVVHARLRNRPWKEPWLRKIHFIGLLLVVAIMLYGLFKPAFYKYDFRGLSIKVWALIPAGGIQIFVEYKKRSK